MGPQDLKQIVIGFVATLIIVSLAVMFPIYEIHSPEQGTIEYVRYPIWDPPTVPFGRAASPEQLAELERQSREDPSVRAIVEKSNKVRKEVSLRPIIFPNRNSEERNFLGATAIYSSVAFGAFVIFKFLNRG